MFVDGVVKKWPELIYAAIFTTGIGAVGEQDDS
jgi:hypothetical protein